MDDVWYGLVMLGGMLTLSVPESAQLFLFCVVVLPPLVMAWRAQPDLIAAPGMESLSG